VYHDPELQEWMDPAARTKGVAKLEHAPLNLTTYTLNPQHDHCTLHANTFHRNRSTMNPKPFSKPCNPNSDSKLQATLHPKF